MTFRAAQDCLDGLLAFARAWPADVVVGAAQAHAAPLVAHYLGASYVRFATDLAEPTAEALAAIAELGPELERLGLYDLPRPMFSVSVAPPSLRSADAPPALPLRHIPYAPQQRTLEPWAYTKGSRPRVLVVTKGDDSAAPDDSVPRELLSAIVSELAALDAEIVVSPSGPGTDTLAVPGHVRCAPVPFDVIAPTCDAVVHFGDAQLVLGCLAHGIPQAVLPATRRLEEHGARIAELGAGTMRRLADTAAHSVAADCAELLADSAYRGAAALLRDELRTMPLPSALVAELELIGTPGKAAV